MPRIAPVTDQFERCWVAYNRKGAKKVARAQWDRLPDEARDAAEKHIPFYVGSRDRQYCKDFERYLRDRVFENPVYDHKGKVLFDPDENSVHNFGKQEILEGFQG